MKNEIDGDLSHIPDAKTANKFLHVGAHYIDGILWLDRDLLRFRLVEEDRVAQVIVDLDRIERAVSEWQNDEKTGVLKLWYRPARSAVDAQADAAHGGRERTIKVQDLLDDLTKDNDISQSRAGVSPRLGLKDEIPFPSPGDRLDDGRDFDD